MRQRILRPLGFFLTFTALFAFILHPAHVHVDKTSDAADHCCVCHTIPMGAARPEITPVPVSYVVSEVAALVPVQLVNVLFSPDSPRGPPCA